MRGRLRVAADPPAHAACRRRRSGGGKRRRWAAPLSSIAPCRSRARAGPSVVLVAAWLGCLNQAYLRNGDPRMTTALRVWIATGIDRTWARGRNVALLTQRFVRPASGACLRGKARCGDHGALAAMAGATPRPFGSSHLLPGTKHAAMRPTPCFESPQCDRLQAAGLQQGFRCTRARLNAGSKIPTIARAPISPPLSTAHAAHRAFGAGCSKECTTASPCGDMPPPESASSPCNPSVPW